MTVLSQQRFKELTDKIPEVDPILVVGDVGVDKYTFGEVKRISPEAPVPVVEVIKEWHKLGLASNVSDNLIGLNVKNSLCGVIGDDTNGNLLESLLEEVGLSTWGIVRSRDQVTTFKERVTTSIQQICRIDYETKKEIEGESLSSLLKRIDELGKKHTALIVEDYGKGLLSQKVCHHVIKYFKERKLLVAVDPSRMTPPHWYRGASLLKPNLTESKIMVEALGYNDHEENIERIAEILMDKLDLEKLVITLGAQGMAMMDREFDAKVKFIPTVAKEVFDVSGAGDTVISTLTASLQAGATLEEAAWLGNCAAGIVVSKKGTARVSIEELTHFYDELLQSQVQ